MSTTVLMVMGKALPAIGTLAAGQAARDAGDYNAAIARQNAKWTQEQSREEARRSRISSRKQLGRMQALYAKAGVTLEGSPADVLAESALTAELDALSILSEGQRRAMGLEAEARLEKYRGKVAQRQSYLKAAGTLLESSGSFASGTGGAPSGERV